MCESWGRKEMGEVGDEGVEVRMEKGCAHLVKPLFSKKRVGLLGKGGSLSKVMSSFKISEEASQSVE